jgi:UDP-N-acetylmuramyl tripeptide synthase
MKMRFIILAANWLGLISRLTRQGSGVMLTGRMILKLQPDAAEVLSRDRRVVLVSGTNGKTTSTALINAAVSSSYETVTNFTGANLFAGVATALSQKRAAKIAVLEVDEMVVPWAITQTKPELLVLLNLGRDQLDRLSEVRVVAQKWKEAVKDLPDKAVILADADDPFVVWAAKDWKPVIWFSSGSLGHIDASTCPECGEVLWWNEKGNDFSCACGFARPKPDWILSKGTLKGPKKQKIDVTSGIPGKAAISNAARAIVASTHFDIDLDVAARAVGKISSVDGRFGNFVIGQTRYRLLLSKNPASWRETLATSADGPTSVLLVVNANTQDGKDTSWLWDVDFAPLAGRTVLVTGERRLDVSARLTVAGIEHVISEDENGASSIFGPVDADLIASYTAFHRLAKMVKR